MSKRLHEAIEGYLRNDGVTQVHEPRPGQRLIALVRYDTRDQSEPYAPAPVEVIRTGTNMYHAYLSFSGTEQRRIGLPNCFTRHTDNPWAWCNTKSGDLYISTSYHGDGWRGSVYKDRTAYQRLYPDVPEAHRLTEERVLSDWITDPESFELGKGGVFQ